MAAGIEQAIGFRVGTKPGYSSFYIFVYIFPSKVTFSIKLYKINITLKVEKVFEWFIMVSLIMPQKPGILTVVYALFYIHSTYGHTAHALSHDWGSLSNKREREQTLHLVVRANNRLSDGGGGSKAKVKQTKNNESGGWGNK